METLSSMMHVLGVAVFFWGFLIFPQGVCAHTLHVTEDAYVSVGDLPSIMNSSSLKVESNRQGYAKFSLDMLPEGTTGTDIAQATLKIYVSKISDPGIIELGLATGTWDEHGVTGLPVPGGIFGAEAITSDREDHFVTVDVTGEVKDWVDGVVPNEGIAILSDVGDPVKIQIDSKENRREGHEMVIEVALVGPEGPAGPAGPPGSISSASDLTISGNLNLIGDIIADGFPLLYYHGGNFLVGSGNLSMTGVQNIAIGGAFGSNTTGWNNTAVGLNALASNTTGNFNTAIGNNALVFNIDGESNTAVGMYTLYDNTTGSQNTAIGTLSLNGNTSGWGNTAIGWHALFLSGGNDNTAIGKEALGGYVQGNNNTAIGARANIGFPHLENATAIGAGAIVYDSNMIQLGDDAVTTVVGPPYSVISDKIKKEKFQPVEGEEVLTKLRSLEVSSWNFIGQDATRFRHYGPMAQDFYAAFGHDRIGTIGTETTINSGDMAGILMIAVKALEQRTQSLATENAALKSALERLQQER